MPQSPKLASGRGSAGAVGAGIGAAGPVVGAGGPGCCCILCPASWIACWNALNPVGGTGAVVGPAGDNGIGIGVGEGVGGAVGRVSDCLRSSSMIASNRGFCCVIYRYENLTLGANPLTPRPLISGGNAEYR